MRWKGKEGNRKTFNILRSSSIKLWFILPGWKFVILLSNTFPEFLALQHAYVQHIYIHIFLIFIPFYVHRPKHNVIFTIGNGRRRERKFIWKFYTLLSMCCFSLFLLRHIRECVHFGVLSEDYLTCLISKCLLTFKESNYKADWM